MGKAGRIACIVVPFLLTLASLICILLVFSGGLNKSSSLQSSLYFFKADTSGFKTNTEAIHTGTPADSFINNLVSSNGTESLRDVYEIYLWNYCEGDKDGNSTKLDKCSKAKSSFWFDPTEVWGLNSSGLANEFPKELQKGLNTYKKVAGWMFIAYIIAFVSTAVELIVSIFAIWSRWGSFATTIISSISGLFIFAAALTSTILFSVLAGSFDSVLKTYNIKASVGTQMLSVVWLAVAFSFAAGLFWLLSTCCCSGRSEKIRRGTKAEKTPYTYEQVAGPYGKGAKRGSMASDQLPLHPIGGSYEPYRHEHV
ncbi:MAG: hypothetical protein M1824_005688 [Vezdaea acicularis]|nr:MAG: hypothetical protein M1824_005688 [Vezdaea acicularis]